MRTRSPSMQQLRHHIRLLPKRGPAPSIARSWLRFLECLSPLVCVEALWKALRDSVDRVAPDANTRAWFPTGVINRPEIAALPSAQRSIAYIRAPVGLAH